MRILLTGASGMVGRNLLEHPRASEHDWLTPARTEVDLRDRQQVRRYLQAHPVELVVHAAGVVGGIRANMSEPVRFLLDNLQIGTNVVSESRGAGVPRLLNLSCSCIYPRAAPNPLKESSLLQGDLEPTNEGYALARIATLKLCEYVTRETPAHQFKTLIASNLFGRYDKFAPEHAHMVPAVIAKLHDAKVRGMAEIDIWGDGTARREFMFAGDFVDGILFAIDQFDRLPPIANIGTGEDHSINQFYEAIAKAVGFDGRFVHDLSKPTGMARKLLDASEIQALGWKPATSLQDGIAAAYDHYLTHISQKATA